MRVRSRRVIVFGCAGVLAISLVFGWLFWYFGLMDDAQFAWQSYRLAWSRSYAFAFCEEGATGTELEQAIGSPDDMRPFSSASVVWAYDGAMCDGRVVETLSVEINNKTDRICWIGGGFHCGPCSLYHGVHARVLPWMHWALARVLGDPNKAGVEGRERGPIVNKGCQPVLPVPAKTPSAGTGIPEGTENDKK